MAARAPKRRRLGPATCGTQSPFPEKAIPPDFEDTYAARRRKTVEIGSAKLPIKTAAGWLHQVSDDRENEEQGSENSKGDESNNTRHFQRIDPQEAGMLNDIKPLVSKSEQQQVNDAKEELAKIATSLNEEPEESPAAFAALARISQCSSPTVRKLAILTQVTVYRDVIPGYRIRPAESGTQEKVSKEVRKLRLYEQSLVKGYQAFVKELARCAVLDPVTSRGIAGVAITSACTLVTSVPHFNFRGELLRILIGKLSRYAADDGFSECLHALQALFRDDELGGASFEAVSLLSKMMRARNFRVNESVVNLFLHLRLLAEYSPQGHADVTEDQSGYAKKKKSRQFRSKRERKSLKEQKLLEKDMALADAQVNLEERDRFQSEILKLVFSNYLRILKLRRPQLMGAVLEGLAKYAHLINMDLFGDLLEAMRELVGHVGGDKDPPGQGHAEAAVDDEDCIAVTCARNTSREILLCIGTAFSLLEGQDAAKARHDPQLDIPFFQSRLYQTLLPLALNPDIELNTRLTTQRRPGAASTAGQVQNGKVNVQTTTVLLLRCLTAVLLPRFNMRAVPPSRVAAFAKQLLTSSLQMPEKSSRALLVLLCDVAKMHGQKLAALWNTEERLGDGNFTATADAPEASNPFAATVWECELLKKHFCPQVKDGVQALGAAIDQVSKAA